MKHFFKNFLIFCAGFAIYMCIEGVWKTAIHPGGVQSFTMGLLGGTLFLIVGQLNKWFTWEMPLLLQSLIGAILVTCLEFLTGVVLNIWLGLGIWDYSDIPCNLLGQICLPFSCAWYILCMVCIPIDDYLRYYAYDEEKPHYHIIKWGKCNK